jgi:hypothetical protein
LDWLLDIVKARPYYIYKHLVGGYTMKRGSFGLITKVAVCMLLFSFVLLPISPAVSMAQQSGSQAGAQNDDDEKKAGAYDSAAGAAKATAKKAGSKGLSKKTVAVIAGVVAVAAGVAIAANDNEPTTEHP